MDKSEKQQEGAQEKQQKSALDRLNQGINTARDAKSAYKISKRFANKLKGAKTTSKGFALAGRGGQLAVRIVTTLASTVEIWGPIVLIVIFFVLVIIAVIVIFTGVSAPPTCEKITAEPKTISSALPATLTVENCSEGVTYSWVLPQIGGVFSASQSVTTLYTPPKVNATQKISILVNVCFASSPNNCSQYFTPELAISKEDLFSCNGYCTTATSCSSPDSPGQGTCPITPSMICCKRSQSSVTVPPCNQVWDRLKSVFGVSVYLGNTIFKDSSCHQLQAIYRTYATSSKSSYYYNLLKKAGPFKIRVYNGARTNSCGGDVLTPNNIKLYVVNESSGFSCFYKNGPTSLLLHETGHQIRQQTQPLIMSTPWLRNLARGDKTCYDRGFIKSYSLRTTIPASESMAEATMLYVMNSKTSFAPGSAGKPIYNFKRECSNTYTYIKRTVYGNDYEFN